MTLPTAQPSIQGAPLEADDLADFATIDPADIASAVQWWDENASADFVGALDGDGSIAFERGQWMNTATGLAIAATVLHAEMRKHQEATFRVLDGLTAQLYAGGITLEQWQIATAAELKDAHLAQAIFGAGGVDNLDTVAQGRVAETLVKEYGYLSQFAQDIVDEDVSEAQAIARSHQYGNSTQQNYWREFVLVGLILFGASSLLGATPPAPAKIIWTLHPAEHCPDCLSLAAGSPYTAATLPTYPGAGGTQCRANCKCSLEPDLG